MGNTKGRYNGGVALQFDGATGEIGDVAAPYEFYDDFTGPGVVPPAAGSPAVGYSWVKKIVGAAPPTVALVANQAGGVIRAALAANSEKEDAALYWNDSLNFDMTKGSVIDFRIAFPVLPSAAAVQMVAGFSSAWIDGPDNASFYVEFGAKANGAISMRTKDGVTTNEIATGQTWLASVFHQCRLDLTDVTDVGFYIDNVKMNTPGQLKFAATGANAILQPYFSMYKASGTGVGSLDIDAVRAWSVR